MSLYFKVGVIIGVLYGAIYLALCATKKVSPVLGHGLELVM